MAEKIKIFKTSDYSIFGVNKHNRAVDETHVKRVVKSMRENGFNPDFPILVNKSDMTVIDGQHRLAAAKILRIPVYFKFAMEEYTAAAIMEINSTSKKWSWLDFATTMAHDTSLPNCNDFLMLINTYEKTKDVLNFTTLIAIIATKGEKTNVVFKQKAATFKFEIPNRFFEYVELLRKVKAVAKYGNHFQEALWCAFNDANFKEATFLEVAPKMRRMSNFLTNKMEIQRVYNYKRRLCIDIVSVEERMR